MNATVHSVGDPEDRADHITHSIGFVDPETAQHWLDNNNARNRDISDYRVAQYVSDMAAGRWEFNAEPIQFDNNGALLNGQHRLTAIVQTGIPQKFLIVRGLAPQAQLTMDQGGRRMPKDQLNIAGIAADNTMAAAIRVYVAWDRGLLFRDLAAVANKITTSEIVHWAQDHPDLCSLLVDLGSSGVRRAPAPPSVALAIALRLSLIDQDDCLEFFNKLVTLEGINGPIAALRNRLDRNRANKINLPNRDIIGLFVMAWNAWRDGRPMSKLQRPTGAVWTVENFPVPR